MPRYMKTIYVDSVDQTIVADALLDKMREEHPGLDADQDWDEVEDERCDYCQENGIENCRHIGM